ncbi:carboxypeptidase-like regulatory domain-containing protein [Granulicella sp. dw_53]|uniref:carboxypeptidase-like regulatory domain-containing protein n=1 Tax=Granulicella sp. dw_53 TaxID=2719792 RepID=UPI001BD3B02D|nr:carboxypeptidase-like regulatory domain-containing protein [Granulicella sp. dw_53]
MVKSIVRVCVINVCFLSCAGIAQTHILGNSSISGRIAQSDGKPVIAEVIAYARPIVNGRRTLVATRSVNTDANGHFECSFLPAGQYVIAVRPHLPEGSVDSADLNRAVERVFYPNATSLDDAELIRLQGGQEQPANVVIASIQPASVVGVLQEHPQQAVIRVSSHGGGYDLVDNVSVDYEPTSGKFKIAAIPPGSYLATADWTDGAVQKHSEGTFRATGGATAKVFMNEIHRHVLEGSLHLENDDALRKVVMPTTLVLDGTGDHAGWTLSAPVAPDGAFRFQSIADGQYIIHTPEGDSAYVTGATVGSRHSAGEKLQIVGDLASVSIQVELGQTQASIVGQLDPSDLVPKQSGLTLLETDSGRLMARKLDLSGKFQFEFLPPGDYCLYAWSNVDIAEYRDSEFLKSNRKNCVELSLNKETHLTNIEPTLIELH